MTVWHRSITRLDIARLVRPVEAADFVDADTLNEEAFEPGNSARSVAPSLLCPLLAQI